MLNDEGSFDVNEKFKPFHETYKIFTYIMTMGLIYPNPKTEKIRLKLILFAILFVSPLLFLIGYDVYKCCLRHDIVNIIRHSTVAGPIVFILLKIMSFYYNRDLVKELIDEINRDHVRYNKLPTKYQDIVEKSLRYHKTTEKRWVACVSISSFLFVIMATVFTIYSQIFDAEPMKYMIHEIDAPTIESIIGWPYYEIMFVYESYVSIYFVLNFSGFDGFFGVVINHACLKIKIFCNAFSDALKESNEDEIMRLIHEIIRDQCKMFSFVNTILAVFSSWFVCILIVALALICNCMYLVIQGHGFDIRYIVFTIATIIHIFMPCWYASKLKSMSQESSTMAYFSGWEDVPIPRVRRTLMFFMARGQVPLQIEALNIIKFDMELFVSIMRTSYTMLTLLQSSS
uniref:Odorant receptor n=1 Tax=Histia rhodope TaxID=1453155 RepID=A0A7G4KBV1_9NEOP|nr:odorant receptor [Histia rhodope]